MVKQIVRDIFFLSQPSEPATKADIQIGKDLQDTLQANREQCVGMAANMIGVRKNIIIVNMGFIDVVMPWEQIIFLRTICYREHPGNVPESCFFSAKEPILIPFVSGAAAIIQRTGSLISATSWV